MVFFFRSIVDKRFAVYMGRDKFENEDLIKYGLPLDVWFHVSDLSSAHVYLRVPPAVLDAQRLKRKRKKKSADHDDDDDDDDGKHSDGGSGAVDDVDAADDDEDDTVVDSVQLMDALPQNVVEEAAQLVKANSIEGHKRAEVKVVYTPWSNLRKSKSMETGQIGFHNDSLMR